MRSYIEREANAVNPFSPFAYGVYYVRSVKEEVVARGFFIRAGTRRGVKAVQEHVHKQRENEIHRENADILQFGYKERFETGFNDEGSASRYFYCAKASKKDRDEGLDMFEDRNMRTEQNREIHSAGCEYVENGKVKQNPHLQSSIKKNFHPTVKPIDLMQYLVRMFTPKGGAILEPFAGSGSTGKATMFENRERNANYTITMIEITHEYIPIIKARCDYAINKYKYDDEKALRERKEKGELNIFDFDYGE